MVIIGNGGGLPKLLYHYLSEHGNQTIRAFSINRAFITGHEGLYCGLPTVPLEELPHFYSPEECDVIMGIGYSMMNQTREKLFRQCKAMGYNVASYIHPSAVIAKNVQMGEGNIILENTLFCRSPSPIGNVDR